MFVHKLKCKPFADLSRGSSTGRFHLLDERNRELVENQKDLEKKVADQAAVQKQIIERLLNAQRRDDAETEPEDVGSLLQESQSETNNGLC